VEDRLPLREYLSERGIETGIHCERAVHQHIAVVEHVGETALPRTERLVDRIVSLPRYPWITEDEAEQVCTAIQEYSQ